VEVMTETTDRYMTAAEVCLLIPGMTASRLKQMRYLGTGPEYLAPTKRTIVYSERRVREWIESSARMSTREAS
jgi:hypothetical protein